MRITDEQFTSSPISSPNGETNDCTVITFAYAMETSYERAHEFMRMVGRKPRKGVSMYRAMTSYEEVIAKDFGRKLEEIKFQWNEKLRRKPTLRKLLNEIDSGMYVVIIRGHTFAVHNNKIVDAYRDRQNARAQRVFKVHKL